MLVIGKAWSWVAGLLVCCLSKILIRCELVRFGAGISGEKERKREREDEKEMKA